MSSVGRMYQPIDAKGNKSIDVGGNEEKEIHESSTCLFGHSGSASFSSNTLTTSQWSILEQAGAVFLPAAGNRYGTSVDLVGSNGFYWSASCSDSYCAYYVFFIDASLGTNDDGRYHGLSVRLVAPAEN